MSFNSRALSMNLNIDKAYKGLYSYSDQYSEVVYRQLMTDKEISYVSPQEETYTEHPTDDVKIPRLVDFTRGISNDIDAPYNCIGSVSDKYTFIGNNILVNSIRNSILNTGAPILEETTELFNNFTKLRSEISISSSQHSPIAGDVIPLIIVNNSYDGTKAASVSFGLTMRYNTERLSFAFKLGEIKQIHIVNSNTNIEAPIESYLQIFANNIDTMINDSFNQKLTEDEMLTTLDVIEDISKNRRTGVADLLKEMLPEVIEGEPPPLPSSWQIFLAIVRYSSFEQNLNVKRLLENAAQSALIIPNQMLNVLTRMENQRAQNN